MRAFPPASRIVSRTCLFAGKPGCEEGRILTKESHTGGGQSGLNVFPCGERSARDSIVLHWK